MKNLIGDLIHCVPLALAPDADVFAGSTATDVISMAHATSVAFLIQHGVGATGTYTVVAQACDDVTPSNTSAITYRYRTLTTSGGLDTWSDWATATTSGITQAAGSTKAMWIEVVENDLTDGYPFVRLAMTEVVDSPVDGAISAFVNHAFKGQSVPSVLA